MIKIIIIDMVVDICCIGKHRQVVYDLLFQRNIEQQHVVIVTVFQAILCIKALKRQLLITEREPRAESLVIPPEYCIIDRFWLVLQWPCCC